MRLKNLVRKEAKAFEKEENKKVKIVNLYRDRVRDYNLIASIDINYINTLNGKLLKAPAHCGIWDTEIDSLEIVIDWDCLD